MSERTVRVRLREQHMMVTPTEARLLDPLLVELESYNGLKFMLDPPPCMAVPGPDVLTPGKVRALIGARLDALGAARVIELTMRIMMALTVNGKPMHELLGRVGEPPSIGEVARAALGGMPPRVGRRRR